MTISFNFKNDGGPSNITTLTPNLLLAYKETKKIKSARIFLSLFFLVVFALLLLNSYIHIIPFFTSVLFKSICIIGGFISLSFLIDAILWNGPRAVLLLTALSTENFEKYLDAVAETLIQLTSLDSIRLTFMTKKELRSFEKELVCTENLKKIHKYIIEDEDFDNLYDSIQYIADNYNSLPEFVVKEVKYEKR